MGKILIAMSGGVDSSVAALLVKQEGYECVGCTMRLFDKSDEELSKEYSCGKPSDADDAHAVAESIGFEHYVANMQGAFKEKVIDRFIQCYEDGITPNPCVICNRYMKFEALYNKALELGCDKIATGHYARVEKRGERYVLRKAVDHKKDQSYVLYSLSQEQLSHTIFPLGGMTKDEIRAIAEREGFVTAHKKESQDICFVPDGNYVGFIERERGKSFESGNFVDMDGNVLGPHKGIQCYTIGQHKRLGICLNKKAYVYSIDPETNTVVLCDNEDLFEREVIVDEFNWTSGVIPSDAENGFRCAAKIRYNHHEQPAVAYLQEDGSVKLVFDEAQRAVTPGQSAVLYDGDVVVGGGIIRKTK